jgi:nucleotide-binding universal stress UspA family protein
MFSRILVPTDFSPASDAAVHYARALAETFGATLHLLHVLEDPAASTAFVADGYAVDTPDIREALRTQARERLARALPLTDRSRFHVTSEVLVGMPAPTIVDYAAATGTSLIVMGTHGRTGLAHLLMGSVAEHVVRTAFCPVLTVRQVIVAEEATVAVAVCRMPIPA